jgi:two-component system alkaline phosphatase synthesis response regulator PhoP
VFDLKTVYLLEDDLVLSEVINEFLVHAGFHVKTFADYRLFFDAIRTQKPDIILLDLMLPNIDGVEVLKYVKTNLVMHNIPIIVVSGLSDENEKVRCLDLGADDYLSKPFGFNELVSRINAVLRRFGLKDVLYFDNLAIDVSNRKVKINDSDIILTKKEFDLLLYLFERINTIITKEELIKEFWSVTSENSRSIDMHINALRKKVFSKTRLEIHTILKVGYKLSEIIES